MKALNINIDFEKLKLTPDEIEAVKKKGEAVIFESILNQAMSAKGGLGGAKQRAYARVLEKLDTSKDGILNLEESEFEVVKEAFGGEEGKFQPQQTRLVIQYQRAIETAQSLGN